MNAKRTTRYLLTGTLIALVALAAAFVIDTSTAAAKGRRGPGRGSQPAPALQQPPTELSVDELNAGEIATLLHMVEEEKLARDVYRTLFSEWSLRVFTNIAGSEQQHMEAIQTLLSHYGIDDPTVGRAPGEFADPALQALYDELVATGSQSAAAALQVGVDIEVLDIADLEAAIAATDQSDIIRVYSSLLNGSRNHLQAFQRNLGL